jgi:hypothetical protein
VKIRTLHLEHFRKFVEPVSLTGLSDGVNVLAECNEFGKSTLLAAIRGVLFERFSSKAQSVQAMRHWVNKTGPKITLEFELDGELYKIEKRFLDKPYAELKLPNGTIHSNDSAEEYLQNLLHFTRAGKTGSKPEDIGMWAALWVTQRYSVDQAELHDAARRTIHECLDREVCALAGGTRGASLLKAVRSEIAAMRSGVQKPVGRYKDAAADLERVGMRVEELVRKQQDLAHDIQELASVERAISQTIASKQDEVLQADVAEAKQKKEAAQRYEDQEQRAKADHALALRQLSDIVKTAEQRNGLREQIAEIGLKVSSSLGVAGDATKNREAAVSALTAQQERIRAAEAVRDEAEERVREARSLVDLARKSEALELLRSRLVEAEAAQQTVINLGAKLLVATVTEDQVQAIEETGISFEKERAVLEAQATVVVLNIPENAKARLLVNGSAEWSDLEMRVIEDLVLEAEGIGSVTIRPGIKDREAQLDRRTQAERAHHKALSVVQVTSISEARAKLRERQELERELAAAKKEVTRLTPAEASSKTAAGLQALKDRVYMSSAALQDEFARREMTVAPLLDVVQLVCEAAEDEERSLSANISVARAPLLQLQQARDAAFAQEATAQAELASAQQRSDELATEYRQSLQHESDQALTSRRASVADGVLMKQAALENIQRGKPADSVAAMETRIKRLEDARKQFDDDLNKRRQTKAVLESRIEHEAGVGVDEQLEDAHRQKESLELEVSRFVRELAVLDLLRRTLEDAEHEAKERYMAPVVQRIVPYLQRLFPSATILCDENFTVTGVLRTSEESFDGLSDGTQEQVAVLTRLAFADLLIDSNRPAMLILDDALAYSDSARLETMFDVLAEAATRMQILVLTCREDAFRRLGGTRLRVQQLGNA